MSQLIKLSDGRWIDPDLVTEVTLSRTSDIIHVRMNDGIIHNVGVDHGQSIYAAQESLVKRINEARSK